MQKIKNVVADVPPAPQKVNAVNKILRWAVAKQPILNYN